MLICKCHAGHMEDKEIMIPITKSINPSMELHNKKDLIESFIDSLTLASNVDGN